MKVLIVGGGGREHTLAWKIAENPEVERIYAAPGNPGIETIGECVSIDVEDIDTLMDFARSQRIDLTVVGPEDPLSMGIVDRFEAEGLRCFGPSRRAAELEANKAFTNDLLRRYDIPGPEFEAFTSPEPAKEYIRSRGAPIVVKASGLAKGKGVTVASTVEEALAAVDDAMVRKIFGPAGDIVVVEECLMGEEASVIVVTDGETIRPLVSSQDHKRAEDGDQGPNTGGMGAYAPAPVITKEVMAWVEQEILMPTVRAMAAEDRPYKGALYAGLMITDDGPKVLEYNCRFGDPETQVVLPLLRTDLVELLTATCEGGLANTPVEHEDRAAVCVVLASGGYPGAYEKSKRIDGLEDAGQMHDVTVFHAGTARQDGEIVTNGGRVLGVTALGDDIAGAIGLAYEAAEKIRFEKMQYRTDIGHRALERLSTSS